MIILIILSAFFSMSETAISSSAESKLRVMIEDRKRGAKKALELTSKFDKTLITLLIGNNIVNVLLSTIAVYFFISLAVAEDYVSLISTASVTIVLLIFGEIVPKVIAKEHPEPISCAISWPIYIVSLILTPLVYFFLGIQRMITRKKAEDTKIDEDELNVLIDQMEDEGSIEEDEAATIRNVFNLNDRSVKDIMVPRIQMEALDYNSTLEQVKNFMIENAYSRVPVYKKDKDHIVGILYERDFFPALVKNPKMSWRRILRPVKFVSSEMKVDALIEELRSSKTHIAIVSGEYGDVLGLVTMEDCLEEIVGEIYDEHDNPGDDDLRFEELEDGSYIVDADMFVEDLFERINVGDCPDDIPSKISGWLFAKCESLPEVGFSINYIALYTQLDSETEEYQDYAKKLTISIYEVEDRRITSAKVTVVDATDDEIEARKAEIEDE
ncbi:MAG: HlyC/CorC family transporter [Acholeplasmatales bacterium]|nr:HlyC/CorC family transporter [Acholeplasmatales bacterium]